jgi:hypothetical protein
MEAGHTPGPWTAQASQWRGTLCVMAPTGWVCGELFNADDITFAEANANARLIAAAPDLLDALQMAKHIVLAEGTREQADQVFAALEKAGIKP